LRGELDRTQLDRAAIVRIAAQLNQSRGKLFERELGMLVDMRSVLTDPQWERMRSELERLQERPRPARPPQ